MLFVEMIIITQINKFSHFSYIDITISVYSVMFIYNNNIINKLMSYVCFRFETVLVLKSLTTSVVYWFVSLDMLFVLLSVI